MARVITGARRVGAPMLLAATATFSLCLAGCGSSAASTKILGSKTQQDCTAVADVLSDGPDPDADPVGHAQAQILPLKQVQISDANLEQAVQKLVSAYRQFTSSDGGQGAAAVSSAQSAVNAICPGAAS